jgi:hypothetical protein
MGFEDSALTRLRRYREEAERSLAFVREAHEAAEHFAQRLYGGLEYTSGLARSAGFEVSCRRGGDRLEVCIEEVDRVGLTLGVLEEVAAESEEELMHPELSRWTLEPSGYSGRILGWSGAAGEGPAQIFAVYRDGLWRTRGLFVERSQGRTDDPEEVINGFCLRILGRLIDLAALTGGVGKNWGDREYSLSEYLEGESFPTSLRPPR